MAKRYRSVSELVRDTIDDEQFVEEFETLLEDKRLAKTLFSMRARAGLSQADMAKLIGCTQGRISKLEHATIDSIKVNDLVDYAVALKLNMSIAFHTQLNAADQVRMHLRGIQTHLDYLAELAHTDEDIHKGIFEFFLNTLRGAFEVVEQAARKLPPTAPERPPILEVLSPEDTSGVSEELDGACCT